MIKAGLILAGLMFVLNGLAYVRLSGALVCGVTCLGLFLPLAAGYLAGRFDQPVTSNLAARAGAGTGVIGGLGAFAAHLVFGLILLVLGGPAEAADRAQQVGITIPANVNPAVFYSSAVGGVCCIGIFLAVLLAGAGALGGLLWYQITGKKAAAGL